MVPLWTGVFTESDAVTRHRYIAFLCGHRKQLDITHSAGSAARTDERDAKAWRQFLRSDGIARPSVDDLDGRWLGRTGSNRRSSGPRPDAFPLGYAPNTTNKVLAIWVIAGNRTLVSRFTVWRPTD
jgi:hypothetical protein